MKQHFRRTSISYSIIFLHLHSCPLFIILHLHISLSMALFLLISSGAIAVTGGLFSNASVPIVIGNVECGGSESYLFNCSYVTDSDDVVSGCDPEGIAAVTCQG